MGRVVFGMCWQAALGSVVRERLHELHARTFRVQGSVRPKALFAWKKRNIAGQY